jgi:hypothetical protein
VQPGANFVGLLKSKEGSQKISGVATGPGYIACVKGIGGGGIVGEEKG